jgi:hypothetical protein
MLKPLSDSATTRLASGQSERVFISYTGVEPIGHLARALEMAGFRPFTSYDLPAAWPHSQGLLKELHDVRASVFLIGDQRQALNSSVELGMALAAGLPVLLVAAPQTELPDIAGGLPVLRVALDDPHAVDRILAALNEVAFANAPAAPHETKPLKEQAVELLKAWSEGAAKGTESPTLEASEARALGVLADAFRSAGVRAVREPSGGTAEADFVVWNREIEPFVGAPLLVEVIGGQWPRRRLDLKVRQLVAYLAQLPSSRWALLVVAGDTDEPLKPQLASEPVLIISLEELLRRMQTESFADIVRALRNERVHT